MGLQAILNVMALNYYKRGKPKNEEGKKRQKQERPRDGGKCGTQGQSMRDWCIWLSGFLADQAAAAVWLSSNRDSQGSR